MFRILMASGRILNFIQKAVRSLPLVSRAFSIGVSGAQKRKTRQHVLPGKHPDSGKAIMEGKCVLSEVCPAEEGWS